MQKDRLMFQLFNCELSREFLYSSSTTRITHANGDEIFACFHYWIHAAVSVSDQEWTKDIKVLGPVIALPDDLNTLERKAALVLKDFKFDRTIVGDYVAGIPTYSGEFTKEFTDFSLKKKHLGKSALSAVREGVGSWNHAPSTSHLLCSGYILRCDEHGDIHVRKESEEFDLTPYKKVSVIAALLAELEGFPTGMTNKIRANLNAVSFCSNRTNRLSFKGYTNIPIAENYGVHTPHQSSPKDWLVTADGSLQMELAFTSIDFKSDLCKSPSHGIDLSKFRYYGKSLSETVQEAMKYADGVEGFLSHMDLTTSFTLAEVLSAAALPFEEFQKKMQDKFAQRMMVVTRNKTLLPEDRIAPVKSDELHYKLFKTVAKVSQWFSASGKMLKDKEEEVTRMLEDNAPLLIGTQNPVIAKLAERSLSSL